MSGDSSANGAPAVTSTTARERETRGVSPVVGVVVLIALTVCLAAVLAIGVGAWSLEPGTTTAAFELSVDGEAAAITIEHVAGDSVDAEALSLTIAVNDEALADQPPVPFVGASGFDGAPDGPFNAAADSEWEVGERAGVVVAETNDPEIEPGDSVAVTLTVDGSRVAALETTAR